MKLVLIEWLDSHTGDGWQRLSSIRDATRPVHCRSVGWLVAESKDHKTLVPHLSGESDGATPYGLGDLTIPNKAIVRMTVLRQTNGRNTKRAKQSA